MISIFQRFNPFNYVKFRGKKIRPKDNHLVFQTYMSLSIPIFILIMGIFLRKDLLAFPDYSGSLLEKLNQTFGKIEIGTCLIMLMISVLVCLTVDYVIFVSFPDWHRQLLHRQKITQMILQNHWYEIESVSKESFFKDLSSNRNVDKITYFPKIYYRMKNGYLTISVEISLNSYQDQLLHLEKKLESGLFCELVEKELEDSFVVYTLLYDTISNRISIDDVRAENGQLRLMKDVYWSYDQLPHMLIAGGTGGGKCVTRSQLKRLCTVG